MTDKRIPILYGYHTYGYYYPATNKFECTHGGWGASVKRIDFDKCEIEFDYPKGVCKLTVLEYIPDDYLI